MAHPSHPEDLVLHAVRVLGFAGPARVAARFRLDPEAVEEALLDFEAVGWVRRSAFGGDGGWSLTDAGRAEDERRLGAELDLAGARELVTAVLADFAPLNERLGRACTDWQLRPTGSDRLTPNDHTDHRWDDRVLARLAALEAPFHGLCARLSQALARFDGYAGLYAAALAQVRAGRVAWVDAGDRDSLHLVWIQFHEDLLSTLGIDR